MRILSRLPEGRGPAPLLGTPLARSRRQRLHPEIVRRSQVDPSVETDDGPDALGPARGIGLALGAGSIGWVLIVSALL